MYNIVRSKLRKVHVLFFCLLNHKKKTIPSKDNAHISQQTYRTEFARSKKCIYKPLPCGKRVYGDIVRSFDGAYCTIKNCYTNNAYDKSIIVLRAALTHMGRHCYFANSSTSNTVGRRYKLP